MGNKDSKNEDITLRDESGTPLPPIALATSVSGAEGPLFPNAEEWARIEQRLSLADKLVSRLAERELDESPSLLFRSIVMSCSTHWKLRHFQALQHFIDLEMDEKEQRNFMETMRRTAKLALRLPKLFPEPIKFLKQGATGEVELTRLQIACLLACLMFGCIQPLQGELVGVFSIAGIYTGPAKSWMLAKLRMLLAYFYSITDKANKHLLKDKVKFRRCKADSAVNWTTSEIRLSKSKLRAQRDGAIEAEVAALQADFANASIGGGVMSNGRLQEEIRFCISPEFLVSLLLCETMKETESILIDGALQFSTYRGYADSLEFDSRRLDLDKQRPGDRLLAIDAKFFTSFKAQFKEAFVIRELNKLHSGLSSAFDPSDPVKNTFASGNWGCGAFGGIPQVKALLQLAACAQSHMSLVYICHTDARIDPDKFMQLYKVLKSSKTTVGTLVQLVVSYLASVEASSEEERPDLFSFVYQRVSGAKGDQSLEFGSWKGMIGT